MGGHYYRGNDHMKYLRLQLLTASVTSSSCSFSNPEQSKEWSIGWHQLELQTKEMLDIHASRSV
jgi:hypothetical protein